MAGFIFFLLWSVVIGENGLRAAEKYPLKPITAFIPLEAGSDGDINMRPLMSKASDILGKPIMIVNKPGAACTLSYRELIAAKPDGYTIGSATGTIVANKLQGLMPYDYRDFTVIGIFWTATPIITASTKGKRNFKTIEEVLIYAKLHPGEVSIATGGVGQILWIATMAFQEATGLEFNIIPQEGAGGFAIAQVAGGHTDLGVSFLASAKPQIEAGNLRFLAVLGSRRAPGKFSDIPTLKEVGYAVRIESTNAVLGPPKMPKDIANKLAKAFAAGAQNPQFQQHIINRNSMPFYLPPEQASQHYDLDRKAYRAIMQKTGILKEK